MRAFRVFTALLLSAAFAVDSASLFACSRVLWQETGHGVYVGRNMDWFEDLKSNMWVLPRAMQRTGLTPVNPLRWTSQYGSFVLTAYDGVVVDGVNERGLAGHVLYLPETKTGPRDPTKPGLAISEWLMYYLDEFASVDEAVAKTKEDGFQLRMASEPSSGKSGTVHIALEDKSGDSAVFELIDGKINVYHDRRYTVMTNQPTFDQQIKNLEQYAGFGGTKRLPGTHEPSDRFVRAAYYSKNLPAPDSERMAVASVMSVMRNVSAPFGIADPQRPNVSATIWRTVYSLNHDTVYYDSTMSANTFWVDYGKLNYSPEAGVKELVLVGNYDIVGNATSQFKPAKMFTILPSQE